MTDPGERVQIDEAGQGTQVGALSVNCMEQAAMRHPFRYSLCVLMLAACGQVVGAELQVRISNADPAVGRVYFALFDSESGYQNRAARGTAVSREGEPQPSAAFADLAPGQYVVTVFQDVNGNRRLDTNLLGVPTEPYGFSRNAMGNMGRPDFAAAAVELSDQDEPLLIDIELRQQP
jgi:uncharacterized protein (DUF2141 family)